MAAMEDNEISFSQQENAPSETPADFTSFQFLPEKIVDFSIMQDGQRSYCVRWKDSWLTEQLLSLTYQHLINEFWSNAAADVNKAENVDKVKPMKSTKASNIKIINKQDNYEPVSVQDQFQQSNITVASTPADQLENITSMAGSSTVTSQIMDQNALLKSQVLTKIQQNQALTSMVVNSDVTLAQYTDPAAPTMISTPAALPKYQQALHQPITIQQQTLEQNDETGKVTFPKHVFSQARFVSKKQHQTIVAAEQPRVNCDICHKSLKTKKMLWAHKVAVHFGGNFPCDICGKKCITGAELRRHMTSHSTERKFVCQYCGLAYKRWSHLYQHLRVHVEEKNFRCDVCHLNFKVQSELKDHCFAEHVDGTLVQCSVCKHKLQTPLAVYHHSMKHTGTRDFLCEICGSNFKRKQHLVTHMKTHLTEKKGPDGTAEVYNCQACDATFALKMELKAHCDFDHPLDDGESVICKTCNKHLNVSHSVYLHGLRHCGAREFECADCQQMFKRKAHLLRHRMDRHSEQPKERKKRSVQMDAIICELCRKSFKYKTALAKHMLGQHGILSSADPDNNLGIVMKKGIKRPHQCDQCGKRFKSKNSLAKHRINKHDYPDPNAAVDQSQEKKVAKDNEDEDEEMEDEGNENKQTSSEIENNAVAVVLQEIGVDDATKQSGALQMVTVEDFKPHASTSASHNQVITVDQATGQLILMSAATTSEDSQVLKKEEMENDANKMVVVEGDTSRAAAGSVSLDNNVMTTQNDQNPTVAFTSRQTPLSAELRQLSPTEQQQLNAGLHQVSISQIINQDGVTLTSVPIQSVQSVENGQNIIDFGQGNNEQIVVLLSALNSEGMQQM